MHFSFGGACWLFSFHFGAAKFISEHCDLDEITVSGASAGSVAALFLLLGVNFQESFDFIFDNYYDKTKYHPFQIKNILHDVLEHFLPQDYNLIQQRIKNKLFVILSKYDKWKLEQYVHNEFLSKEDCVKYVKASCHIPVFSGIFGYPIGNNMFYDGGMVSNKIDQYENFIEINLDTDPKNINRVSCGIHLPYTWVFFPQPKNVMQLLFDLGYLRMHEFLSKKNIKQIPPFTMKEDTGIRKILKKIQDAKYRYYYSVIQNSIIIIIIIIILLQIVSNLRN